MICAAINQTILRKLPCVSLLIYFVVYPYYYRASAQQPDTILLHKAVAAIAPPLNSSDSTLFVLRQLLAQCKAAGYHNGTVTVLQSLVEISFNRAKYDSTILYGKEALALLHLADVRHTPALYKQMANASHAQGNLEQALNYYQKTLQQYPDSSLRAETYIALSALYIQLTQTTVALNYLDQAAYLSRALKQPRLLASVMLNKSQCYSIKKDYVNSNKYLDSTLLIAQRHHLPLARHGALSNLGFNHLLTKEPRKALYFLLQTQPSDSSLNMYYQLSPLRMIGEAYFQMKHYDRAIYYLNRVVQSATAGGIRKEAYLCHKLLTKVYEEMKDYQSAFRHQSLYVALNDSFANQEITSNINTLEAKYQSAEKDKHIVKQQLKISQQEHNIDKKNIWIGIITAGSVLLTTLLIALYINYRNNRRLQSSQIHILQQQQEILSKENKIRELQSVVAGEEKERERIARELHDGVMTEFSAIKMNMSVLPKLHTSLENNKEFNYLIHQLDHATHELRKTAHNLMPDVLVEKGLGTALAFFCESLHIGHSITIDFRQYGELPRFSPEFELIVYRTVQELIQNILKHADASKALLQIDHMNHLLTLTIEDNGKGFPPDFLSEGKGKGLKNIRKRIEMMDGLISFSNRSQGGAAINIEFDLEKNIRNKKSAYGYQSNDRG